MNLYVIRSRLTNLFVADRSEIERTGKSYTLHLPLARTFTSAEAARPHAIPGEDVVLNVADCLFRPDDSGK